MNRGDLKSTNKEIMNIVTWNVQRMSLGDRSRRKARAVAQTAVMNKWEVTLRTEVWAEKDGVVWMGDGDDLCAIIHGKKTGILLWGQALSTWCEGGQKTRRKDRSTAVKIGNITVISTYMPVDRGNNKEEIEVARDDVVQLSKWANCDDILVIGGDWNAHVGANKEKPVCGKFGL